MKIVYTHLLLLVSDISKAVFSFELNKGVLEICPSKYNLNKSKNAIKNLGVGVQLCTVEMWTTLRDVQGLETSSSSLENVF